MLRKFSALTFSLVSVGASATDDMKLGLPTPNVVGLCVVKDETTFDNTNKGNNVFMNWNIVILQYNW